MIYCSQGVQSMEVDEQKKQSIKLNKIGINWSCWIDNQPIVTQKPFIDCYWLEKTSHTQSSQHKAYTMLPMLVLLYFQVAKQ